MSPSLFLVAWMGLVAAALAQRGGGSAESMLALAVIVAAAVAAFVEAGSLETGAGSRSRRPLQAAVCLLLLSYVVLLALREAGIRLQ